MPHLTRSRLSASLVVGLVACCTISACQKGGVADKTGSRTVVLKLATIDEADPNGQTPGPQVFLNEIQALSHGQIKVNLVQSYENGSPNAESDIVSAIARGDLDGGWPSTRAFQQAGISGPSALEAPMVVTSLAAEKAISSGPAGAAVLHSLDKTGVLGLALTVGPLRRIFATRPVVSVSDWKGLRFRAFNSPVQEQTIKALGGTPVDASYNFPDMVRAKTLDGAESDVAQYSHNSYGNLLPAVTRNVVLWPRMEILSISRRTFDRLDAQQQGWLREAAADAVASALSFHYDESSLTPKLCTAGVSFYDASSAQLAAMQAAVKPVIATIAADPNSGPVLRQIESAAGANPGIDMPQVPASCLKKAPA